MNKQPQPQTAAVEAATTPPAPVTAPAAARPLSDVWTTTASGRQIFLLQPRTADISIDDIAHHLAHVARWGGATREFYSVAQHSVFVAALVLPEHRPWALLHDASEYLLGDVVKYFKHWSGMASYRVVEAQLQTLIFQRFGLRGEMPDEIHTADELVAITEAQDLFDKVPAHFPIAFHDRSKRLPEQLKAWPPDKAKANFLKAFHKVMADRSHAQEPTV